MNILTLPEATIFQLPRPEKGDQAFARDTNKYYSYDGEKWNETKPEDISLNVSIYEINKQLSAQVPALDEEQLKVAVEVIDKFHSENLSLFYLLYSRELSYFTIMQKNPFNVENITLGELTIDCLKAAGEIKSVGFDEAINSIEIWVNDTLFYLFGIDEIIERFKG